MSSQAAVAPQPQVVSRFTGTGDNLRVGLRTDPPGVIEVPALRRTVVAIHVGPPTYVVCKRGGESHRGTVIHGDIDIIPHGIRSRWELPDGDTALILSLAPDFLHSVAQECEFASGTAEIRNRFQTRDTQLEHLGWALQEEMERGYPCGLVYFDGLAKALAAQLLSNHSSVARRPVTSNSGLCGRRLKQVLSFIEENLGGDLSLAAIARVAGLSVSHCKVMFRRSVGMPVHQYVIRRRVERAATLLRAGQLSISQIALETGFAHQSHLALHMRRVLGISPRAFQGSLQ